MLLLFLPSENKEGVFYWSHERELGDHSLEKIADSFRGFMGKLAPVKDFN
jgi:hypothetical protein